ICPSTTSTALATLFTGLEPVAHGLLGYELWLGEYGLLTQMLALQPAMGPGKETLLDWGLKPESFLPAGGLGEWCDMADIQTTALVPAQYAHGALTRMCYRHFYRIVGYADVVDMWESLHHLLGHDDAERSLYIVYWGGIDRTVHHEGARGGHWRAALDNATRAAEERFFWRLTRDRRADTAVVVLADHGFVHSPPEGAHAIDKDPAFVRHLLMPFSGESRVAYLHCLDANNPAARADLQEALGSGYVVLDAAEALKSGLFGTSRPHPETTRRLGHLIVIARGERYLLYGEKAQDLRGRHGGLTPEEMLIPWLLARLDAL
ncbi:MAG: alkaline phosphatase family protein, partial [Chloroflexi bacterium]|nr:alkaline phosphatase family protein [Chloroflexota bacterium]